MVTHADATATWNIYFTRKKLIPGDAMVTYVICWVKRIRVAGVFLPDNYYYPLYIQQTNREEVKHLQQIEDDSMLVENQVW